MYRVWVICCGSAVQAVSRPDWACLGGCAVMIQVLMAVRMMSWTAKQHCLVACGSQMLMQQAQSCMYLGSKWPGSRAVVCSLMHACSLIC